MIIKHKFNYTTLPRIEESGERLYQTPTGNLPSVTTILSATKSQESKLALDAWRNRIGHERASQTVTEAAAVGTLVHNLLEHWLTGDREYDPGNNLIHRQAKSMAQVIMKNVEDELSEIWGNEVSLYYPGLYAGTSDLVGVWKGMPTICDFKQSNKPKKSEWIDDYRLQVAAYALAHNAIYNTDIKQGAIFMCSRDGTFQLFEVTESEFTQWSEKWAERVDSYYQISGK